MRDAEHPVAGLDLLDDDADRVDVEHLGQRQPLLGHLAVDAVEVLLAPDHARVEFLVAQALLDRGLEPLHHLAAIAARLAHRVLDHAVAHRVERGEAEVLELEADGVHAQAIGDRHVDVERLARDAAALGRGHHRQRAHVVQAVGELDQDDAQVAHHRHHHLAEVLGLRLVGVLELHLGELADPVDQFRDLLTELRGQLLLGDPGVLDDVVQPRCDDAVDVEAHLREHVCDVERVADVGLAGLTELPGVCARAEQVGAMHDLELRPLEVGLERVAQVAQAEQRGEIVLGIERVGCGLWRNDAAGGRRGQGLGAGQGRRGHAGVVVAARGAALVRALRAAPGAAPPRRPGIPRRAPAR